MTFNEWLDNNWEKNNMFSPELDGQKALDFLKQYLLGEDWYSVNPISTKQINCEVVHDILYKYSKKYRKEIKTRERKEKWKN